MSTYDGLSGKVAIITGGADSIGAAVVKAMHAAGVQTVIAARSEDKGNALARSGCNPFRRQALRTSAC